MENWGLMTFNDMQFLVDSGRVSVRDEERVSQIIAHELAHQVPMGAN
jgi:aminopeptidase N